MTVDRALGILALVVAVSALVVATIGTSEAGALLLPDSPPAATGEASHEWKSALTALERRVSQLELSGTRAEVIDQQLVEQLVQKALDARGATGASPSQAGAAARGDEKAEAAAAALAQELAQTPFGPRRDELWRQVQELGGVDAAVAYFEHLAAAAPASADAQTDLGAAYVQKLLQATDEKQRVELGKKIDASFDQALALQPDHWEARFRKAVGLSYGTALSGRQDEAIKHFERLVTQQANLPANASYAQTYLYLGRLHAQRGNSQLAREVWQQGLHRHPQDPELLKLLQQ